MIYILFVWIAVGCNSDGVCRTMPVYNHSYTTAKACHDALFIDDNLDQGAFCVEIPKQDLK